MKIHCSTLKLTGLLLCGMLLLFACSKKGDSPSPEDPEKTQLQLEASATDIDEGDEVDFTITADGETVDADIYVGDTKISGTEHKFSKTGVYQVTAKKDGYTDSGAEEVKVYKVDVYVAGNGTSGYGDNAIYWKNGKEHSLTDKNRNHTAWARSIFVDEDDVYVAGHEDKGPGMIAKYWKNGEEHSLNELPGSAWATSIFVDNGDVYIAGEDGNGPVYWKNDQKYRMDGNRDTRTESIFVDKGDVHVAGYTSIGPSVAKYWKNGTATDLTDGSQRATAHSIFVDQGDVYVAGYEYNGSRDVAKYWKNGMEHNLTDGSDYAWATSIFIENGDVYVAGNEGDIAKYWKNGKEHRMQLGVFPDGDKTSAMFVDRGNVYVAGCEVGGGLCQAVKYWKNGEAVKLAEEPLEANSIFVSRSLGD